MVRDGAKQGSSQGEQREQCSPFGPKKSENRADFGIEGAVLEIFYDYLNCIFTHTLLKNSSKYSKTTHSVPSNDLFGGGPPKLH